MQYPIHFHLSFTEHWVHIYVLKILLRSLTTIGLLLVLIVIGVIVLFQNNNIEHKLLKENTSLKTSLARQSLLLLVLVEVWFGTSKAHLQNMRCPLASWKSLDLG